MKLRDVTMAVIMLSALLGLVVLITSIPIGLSPKVFGALAFGVILVFGFTNMIMVVLDSRKNRSKDS